MQVGSEPLSSEFYLLKENKMDIPINVKVFCVNGECGRSTAVLLDPTNEKITHLVVKSSNGVDQERMVPVDFINQTTPKQIQLICTKEEFANMDDFIEHHYIQSKNLYYEDLPNRYFLWPYAYPVRDHTMEDPYVEVKEEHIPQGELAIHRGAHVEAVDGRVGEVDEFLIDPANDEITHLILREGHLWGKKDVTIPVSKIDHMTEDTVYLSLDKTGTQTPPISRQLGKFDTDPTYHKVISP
jgi:sporulation protein YlmC with PRC-barrel domain